MYEELVTRLRRECLTIDRYDILSMRNFVRNYCRRKKIRIDSPDWIYLIDEIWCDLEDIRKEFDDIESFEFSIRDNSF